MLATVLTLGPVYLSCAIALAWSAYSASPALARVLRWSGAFWAVWLTLCFMALAVLSARCDGNLLYGFTDCRGFSAPVARTLTAISLLSFMAGIVNGGLLVIGGSVWEAVTRTRDRDH